MLNNTLIIIFNANKNKPNQTILQHTCKLLFQVQIHYVIRGRLKSRINKLKNKILKSVTPKEFHLVEKIPQNLYRKSFDSTNKGHIQKFDDQYNTNHH